MSLIDNISIGKKLIGGFLLIAAIVAVIAILGYDNMEMLNDTSNSMYHDNLVPIQALGMADGKLFEIRGDLYKYMAIPQERESVKPNFEANFRAVTTYMDEYRAANLIDAEKTELQYFAKTLPLQNLFDIDSSTFY